MLDSPAEWCSLQTQADADRLMQEVCGLHDAHIDAVTYTESQNAPTCVSVTFDLPRLDCHMELCFTEPTVAHITNGRDNNGRDILASCLYIDAGGVFWADEGLKREKTEQPLHPEITYIRAQSVRVRRVE